ncbi:MAG: histidine kinase dimerization/phospho-acceptor domain-containing protein [Chloroflexota bacterium]
MTKTRINLPTKIDLERFISDQSHDLRTPFNHIVGFSRMLLNYVEDEPLSESEKEDLGTIYRSGMRALMRINGLIDSARINRHEIELDITELNIGQLIEQSQIQWDKFNLDDGIQTEYRNLASSTTLHADEQLARQFIPGFLAYVATYCETKAQVTFTIEEEPDWFVLTFASSGTKSKRLSEMDLELLGFVNRAFVEQHGGQIRKAEENDEGATIQITLPKT